MESMSIILIYATIRLYNKPINLPLYILLPWLGFLLLVEDLMAIHIMADVIELSTSFVLDFKSSLQQQMQSGLLVTRLRNDIIVVKSLRPFKCEMNNGTYVIEKSTNANAVNKFIESIVDLLLTF